MTKIDTNIRFIFLCEYIKYSSIKIAEFRKCSVVVFKNRIMTKPSTPEFPKTCYKYPEDFKVFLRGILDSAWIKNPDMLNIGPSYSVMSKTKERILVSTASINLSDGKRQYFFAQKEDGQIVGVDDLDFEYKTSPEDGSTHIFAEGEINMGIRGQGYLSSVEAAEQHLIQVEANKLTGDSELILVICNSNLVKLNRLKERMSRNPSDALSAEIIEKENEQARWVSFYVENLGAIPESSNKTMLRRIFIPQQSAVSIDDVDLVELDYIGGRLEVKIHNLENREEIIGRKRQELKQLIEQLKVIANAH